MDHPLYKPLLAASITASSFLAGCQLSLSQVSLATILGPPHVAEEVAVSQFHTLFTRGFRLCPSSAIFSGLCCLVNAAMIFRRTGQVVFSWEDKIPRLLLAGSLMTGIIPYTLAFIVPVEEPLLRRDAELAKARTNRGLDAVVRTTSQSTSAQKDTFSLLAQWDSLNLGRTLLPIMGVAVAWSLW